MHEYSITTSIIDIVKDNLKDKKVEKVKSINFEIKKISNIEPESIRFYYNFLTEKDSVLKGAELNFKQKELRVKCLDCEEISEINDLELRCTKCSSKNVSLADDDDLSIISVDIK